VFTAELTTVEKAPTVAANYADGHCWFSVQPLHDRVTSGRSAERDVTGLRELYADFDVKPGGLPDYSAAGQVISDLSRLLGADPVAVVNSGHGLQPHWQVERGTDTDWSDENHPHWLDGKALVRRWGRLVARIAADHGGHVDGVFDLARVLRVPGTTNRKAEPVPVTIEFCGGAPVSLEQIRETLDACNIPEWAEDRERLGDVKAPSTDWAYAETTCSYVIAMVRGWSDDMPAARHPWLVSQATRLAAAHRAGCITEADYTDAVRLLTNRFRVRLRTGDKRDEQPTEISDALAWAVATVETKTDDGVRRELGNHPHPDDPTTIDTFWYARPELAHISDFARARRASPWATLGVELVRVVVAIGPHLQLPGLIGGRMSLNSFVALVGVSGAGKDTALAAAADAVDAGDLAEHTPGSGEGIAHCFVTRNRKGEIEQHETAVLFVAPEVDMLNQLAKRQGSTLGPVLRIAYSGARLGFAYVDRAKNLEVKAHAYRLGLIVGVQPERARPLLDEADAGTPPRFLWLPTLDPDAPDRQPDAPEPILWHNPTWTPDGTSSGPDGPRDVEVCDTARQVIDQARLDRLRGNGHRLDGHALLTRLKVAAALALLNGRTDVNDEDWQLAGHVTEISDATRQTVVDALGEQQAAANRARGRDEAERAVVAEEHTAEHHIRRVAQWITKRLHDHGDWMTHKELHGGLNGRDRQWFAEAITRLVLARSLTVEETDNHGPAGRRYKAVS
jgi:hypothetical protein